MMSEEIIRALMLAFIQGLSEFLPISSSAHLILPAQLGAWPDQGLAFDVSVHMGTLTAVLHYFRQDLARMVTGVCKAGVSRTWNQDARLAWLLVISTIPLILTGLIFKDFIDTNLRSGLVIACASIVFALVLYIADRLSSRSADLSSLDWKKALLIGFAQMLALIPGTSRSGITMSAALLCHLDRVSASRYSFLLSIPAIAGAGFLMSLDLFQEEVVNWSVLGFGAVISGVVAWLTIHFFLGWIEKAGFLPFVIYRILLGLFLFLLLI